MSNNFFNFKIPYFSSQFSSDFTDFQTIVDDNTDNTFDKIWQLYWLRSLDKIKTLALEYSLRVRGIKFTVTDSVIIKRFKLRNFVSQFANKGLLDTYLDLAETITGIRGAIGYSIEGLIWDEWEWADGGDNEWGGIASDSIYNVFFNVKTTDEDELDLIEALLKEKTNRPAFYQIILIDNTQNILRTI